MAYLEPIQELAIHRQGVGGVKRLSMIRIIARRTKATVVLAKRSKSRTRRRLRLIQANIRSTIHRFGKTTKRYASVRLTISNFQQPVAAPVAAILGPW